MNDDRTPDTHRLTGIFEGARALPASMRRFLLVGLGVLGLLLGALGGPAESPRRKPR